MLRKLILQLVLAYGTILISLSSLLSAQVATERSVPVGIAGAGLDSLFNRMLSSQNYVALGACLIKEDRVIWQGACGYADREKEKLLSNSSIFQLASLSKTVTAAALLQLYEKGLFRLDDDVNKYIPIKVRNPYFPEKPITFRMLLTHTGGFEDVAPDRNKIDLGTWGDSPIAFNDFVEGLFTPGGKYYSVDYFGRSEPGTKYGYSNIAYSLIGYIVEKLTKKDFADYCRENIFMPLGMHDTGWHLKGLDTGRIVIGYGFPKEDGTYKRIGHFGVPGYPEGMLRTTIDDYSKFLICFINKGSYRNIEILKPETVELMLKGQSVAGIPSRSFPVKDIGLCWIIMEVDGEEFYSMNGFSGSIFTNAFFSPENKTAFLYYYTGITMKNMQGSFEITRRLKDALKKHPPEL